MTILLNDVNEKRIGILEYRSDRFINDVIARLQGMPVEFLSLSAERVPIHRDYRVVIDRLSFSYPFLKEVLKNLALNGTYVINNPFTATATNKLVDTNVGNRLGLPFPRTIILPDKEVIEELKETVSPPDLARVVEEIKLPCILKPFDGYAWQDVYVINALSELENLYQALSSRYVLIVQQLIRYKEYFRVFCIGKRDVLFIKWTPKPFSMGHYQYCDQSLIGGAYDNLVTLTIKLNEVLDLDVNVVEWCLDEAGKWWIIDAFNEVPEVIPEALPPEYYAWIVDKFSACVRDKFNSEQKNRILFIS